MFKKFRLLMLLPIIGLTSCSQGGDEPKYHENGQGQKHSVELALSRATAGEFQAAEIDKFTVFVYKIERKGTSLFAEREVSVADGRVSMEFTLGDNFQTFLVANAKEVLDKESLETVKLRLDPASDKPVWASTPVRFASDKSTSTIPVTLRRMVSRVEFVPADAEADLASQSYFDRIDLTFGNIAGEYLIGSSTAIASDYTVSVTAANNYRAGFYTFETTALDDATLDMHYYKGAELVNQSDGVLETGVKYAANNRYTLKVPVLNESFTQGPWASAKSLGEKASIKATVIVSDL